jgi:hypothetical protein
MQALVVFHGHGEGAFARLLKRGFRHVFCAVSDGRYWIAVDGKAGVPEVKVVASAHYDLAAFYREQGFTVVSVAQGRLPPRGPVAVANCVGMVKAALAIRAPFAVTPYGLFKHLTRRARSAADRMSSARCI